MFCAPFLSKKTILLDFNIKTATWPSFSWFDQSLVIPCLNKSKGDKDQKLSPEEYLNMIRPDLRNLINKHKPIEELSNDNNNNDNNNNNNNNDTDRGEWIIQLTVIVNCIFTRSFKEKCTMHSKSEAVEVYMGSDTENVNDALLIHFYNSVSVSNS